MHLFKDFKLAKTLKSLCCALKRPIAAQYGFVLEVLIIILTLTNLNIFGIRWLCVLCYMLLLFTSYSPFSLQLY